MIKKIFKSLALVSFLALPLASCTNDVKKEMTSNQVPNNEVSNNKESGSKPDNNNTNSSPRDLAPPVTRTEGNTSEARKEMGNSNPSSNMSSGVKEADRPSVPNERTRSSQLSLKSRSVIASDLVTEANGSYSLNWSKFDTNLSQEQQRGSRLMNLVVNDREGDISFNLLVDGNQTISFKQKVVFDFNFLRALTFSWTDLKSSTTNSSLTELEKVKNAEELSKYASPVLSAAFNDKTNYYSYLSSWLTVNLTYVSVDKKLEENELIFEYQLSNLNKKTFYQIDNNTKHSQTWHSNKNRAFLSYASDLAKAANDVVTNTSSELFSKEISHFYNETTHMVDTEKLEIGARNEGLIKFSNSDYNNHFAITLMQDSAFFNTDTNELTFTVEIKPKDNDQLSGTAISKTFTITLTKAKQQ